MKYSKKLIALVLSIITVMSIFAIHASAIKSVNLYSTQDASYSGSESGLQAYIDDDTFNNPGSSQRMRAQFEYKANIFNWVSDERLFIPAGKCVSESVASDYKYNPIFKSSRFNNSTTFRLALSPESQTQKGVSGSGVMYIG